MDQRWKKIRSNNLDLDKREFGYWFAPFERELIFLRSQDHIGWVVHTSDKTFKLQLTPFYRQTRNYTYIAPDPKLMPPEKMCVEVVPLKIIRRPIFNGKSLYGSYDNAVIVDGFKEFKVQTQKPDIGYKDFLYYCSVNWVDPQEDGLDKMLALQMVSCPYSFYGEGGIGALASKLSAYGKLSKSIVPSLRSTYSSIISSSFQRMNDKYFFSMITNQPEMESVNQIRQHNRCEVNYSRPCLSVEEAQITSKTLPIQIPLLIRTAEYKSNSNDLEEPYLLLQYQLTALMKNPDFGKSSPTLTSIEANIRKIIGELRLKRMFEIDANTINKLALSFSRLHLTDSVDSHQISEATKMAEMFFANWKDWKYFINESDTLTHFRSEARPSDAYINFTHDQQRFLVELQKLHDETNEEWIDWKALEERLNKKIRNTAFDIAVDLTNLGLIIQKSNFSKIRKVNFLHG